MLFAIRRHHFRAFNAEIFRNDPQQSNGASAAIRSKHAARLSPSAGSMRRVHKPSAVSSQRVSTHPQDARFTSAKYQKRARHGLKPSKMRDTSATRSRRPLTNQANHQNKKAALRPHPAAKCRRAREGRPILNYYRSFTRTSRAKPNRQASIAAMNAAADLP